MCTRYVLFFFALVVSCGNKAVLVKIEHFIGGGDKIRAGNVYLLFESHRTPREIDAIQVCALRDVLLLRDQKKAIPLHIYVEVPSLLAQETDGRGMVTTDVSDLVKDREL